MIVLCTIIMLFFDILASFDGSPDTFLPVLNHTGNFLLYFFSPLIPALWLLFVRQFINLSKKADIWLLAAIITVFTANCSIVLLSLKGNWFYEIDADNIYHRGPYYSIAYAFAFILLAVATFLLIFNRNKIERRYYTAFLIFTILPLVSMILQNLTYGFSFIYNGVSLSVFILFLFVQVQDVLTDYLTGVANRKKLEMYLRKKVLDSTPWQTFSAIMLDIDNFKNINDTLGHRAGDSILRSTANLLRECIGEESGLIARYGGDEFCIVLDTSDPVRLKEIAAKIRERVDCFNESSILSVKLAISMGYATYKYGMSVDEFQNTIDKLMYEHKRCPI